ncbi:MAG: hypothetical protein KDD42_04265, partial [Bdellovibrionales bacterium]|nr:hypothetical protein [Bdellovibrionales bacterium]
AVVGQMLNEIGKDDPEVLKTVIEVMETENLLRSGASVELVPSNCSVLVQMGETPKLPPKPNLEARNW